ncbi:hypothetical protein BDQ17DRAFT_676376 [Cyathus striatus]|nr:hypothetical protein BDQ17DRAFT_676376 [Cyathus striatus]
MQATTSIPNDVLTSLESQLLEASPGHYQEMYDSDDDETRTVYERFPKILDRIVAVMEMGTCDVADLIDGTGINNSGRNGWNLELTYVDEIRGQENGAGDDDSDVKSDLELIGCSLDFCGWPLPRNRQLSCTVSIACVCESADSGIMIPV